MRYSLFTALILLSFLLNSCISRTPISIAERISNIKIQKSTTVVHYDEKYSFTGEGYILVILEFNDSTYNSIIEQALSKDYKDLNVESLILDGFLLDNIGHGFRLPHRDINSISEGKYSFSFTDELKQSFKISVLDITKRELIVYSTF